MHLSAKLSNHSSTGQQGNVNCVILAHARLQDHRLGRVPIMLFDDVAAHLDAKARRTLVHGVLGGQCWFSGTDGEQFDELKGKLNL